MFNTEARLQFAKNSKLAFGIQALEADKKLAPKSLANNSEG